MGFYPLAKGDISPYQSCMTANQQLLIEIEAFLATSGMTANAFSHRVANDGKFLARIRNGGGVTLDKASAIRAFMASPEARAIIPRPHQRHEERNQAA
jgi:hypothetical protein